MSTPAPAANKATSAFVEEAVPKPITCKHAAPARRGQFDNISLQEYDELHERSQGLRDFLMANVMSHLTTAMLEVVRLTNEDKVAKLADMLAIRARHVEDRANAYAYLRYRSSLAKLSELRREEIDEGSGDRTGDVSALL